MSPPQLQGGPHLGEGVRVWPVADQLLGHLGAVQDGRVHPLMTVGHLYRQGLPGPSQPSWPGLRGRGRSSPLYDPGHSYSRL